MNSIDALLKSDIQEDRFHGIDSLADSMPPDITRLKKIAGGGMRRLFVWYDMYDQIHALERMADTKLPEALSYIREFFYEDSVDVPYYDHIADYEGRPMPTNTFYSYPNAKGDLRVFLNTVESSQKSKEASSARYKILGRIANLV
ncbi:MAG: hypothetical protein HGA85_00675 [Nanoarchaeota archaeon]|nr:hypothetical protein [Nanoarchaeota archaeon]